MIIPKSFYFLRHGQTDHNANHILAGGKLDEPLNEKGKWQVQTLGSRLVSPPFKKIICSPMKRTVQTAELFTQASLILEPNLREWDMGDFEGGTYESFFNHIKDLSPHVRLPNGESKNEFFERSIQGINKALKDYGEDILFVSHGGVCGAIFEALGFPVELMDNAELLYFHYRHGKWHIVKL